MMEDYSQKFLLLPRAPRGRFVPREPRLALTREQVLRGVEWLVRQEPEGPVHYDLETPGLRYEDPNLPITTLGIACKEWCVGLNLAVLTIEEQIIIWEWLAKRTVGGFNLSFDAAWPWGEDIRDLKVSMDTAVIFRALATDAGKGTRLNLETLIAEVLNWPSHQKTWLEDRLRDFGLSKDEMYKLAYLDAEGYTKYCAWDAEASLHAEEWFREVCARRQDLSEILRWNTIWNNKMKRIVRSQYKGITIDREKCYENIELVNVRMLQIEQKILNHPETKPFFEEWANNQLKANYQLKVTEKRTWAKKEDKPWMAPEIWSFEPHPEPEKLQQWLKPYGGRFYRSEPRFDLKGKTKSYPRFNFRSPQVMGWMIYECLLGGQYEIVYTHREDRGEMPKGYVKFSRNGMEYEADLTQPGAGKPTGGDVLKPFGEIGKLIDEFKELQKLSEEFLWKYYEASAEDGKIHPGLMIHGAATSRASGGSSKKSAKAGGRKKEKPKTDGSAWADALGNGETEDAEC